MAQFDNKDILSLGKTPLTTVLILAWPAIVEQLLLTLVQYVDTAMVGSIGPMATAAVGINASIMWLINGIISAIAVGFSVVVAQSIGSGDLEKARNTIKQALITTVFMGILLMLGFLVLAPYIPLALGADSTIAPLATKYLKIILLSLPLHMGATIFSSILRCMGDTKTPMFLNATTNVINIILNIFLIFPTREINLFGETITLWGADLGVVGAATATAISTGFIGLMLVVVMFKRKDFFGLYLRESYRPNKQILGAAVKLGLPVALERITITMGQVLMTMIVTRMGSISLAANHIAVTAESISYLPASGIAFAATTLVGQAIGAGKKEEAVKFGKLATRIGVVFLCFTGTCLFLFSNFLAGLFTNDLEVQTLASQMLKIVAFAQPLFAASIVLSGALRGAGDTKWPFAISLLSMWGVRVVLALILTVGFGFGLPAVWIAMVCDLNTKGILCIIRFKTGKWYKKIVT